MKKELLVHGKDWIIQDEKLRCMDCGSCKIKIVLCDVIDFGKGKEHRIMCVCESCGCKFRLSRLEDKKGVE